MNESTMLFCRKISRNNMARVVEIEANRLHHSPDHHMEEFNGFAKLENVPISFDFLFALYLELL